jgi:murein L,D-transpeptidase YcbB/YkuD
MDVFAMADLLLDDKQKAPDDNVQRQYNALKKQLANYVKLAKNQPEDSIVISGKLKKCSTSMVIPAIKKRLQMMDYLPENDTSSMFTDTLETAVRAYQLSLGTKDDGIISRPLVKQLNIPLRQRVAQLVVNMNRLAWMPGNFSDNYIQVNIPEFMLHVYEGKSTVFDMPVVVGREGTSTMMFAGDMNQVVFSPYWNVPESIVKKEIVPGMEKNPDYIENHHMEITGTRNDLPVVRQLPGGDNSLGKVKFLFPNSYDIYLHDTNAKYLFDKEKRAYSHGCIRLADAEKMANYVLRNDPEWTPEKITEAMNSDAEKFVRIKNPIPVLITYLTAWVGEDGKLNFRDDIYGHDEAAAAKLFAGF